MISERSTTPDGAHVLYRAQQERAQFDLFRAPISAGPGVRLNALLPASEEVLQFLATPDSSRVVYLTRDLSLRQHLFVVPTGGGVALELDADPLVDGKVTLFDQRTPRRALAPDSRSIVFGVELTTTQRALYTSSLDGGTPRLLAGPAGRLGVIGITPDSSTLVFLADLEVAGRIEVYRVPIDGSGGPLRLSPAPTRPGTATEASLSPDGSHVVFASTLTSTSAEVWSAPLAGGPAVRLDTSSRPKSEPRVTSDSRSVVFRTSSTGLIAPELWSAPIDGSTEPVSLFRGAIARHELAPDGTRVVLFATSPVRLAAVSVNGGDPLDLLPAGLVLEPDGGQFLVGPGKVFFRAQDAASGDFGLYSTSLAGSPAQLLQAGARLFELSPDGSRLLVLDPLDRWTSLAADGNGARFRLENASSVDFSADSSSVLVHGDLDTPSVGELYASPATHRKLVKLNGSLAEAPFQSSEVRFHLAPDEERVHYVGREVAFPGTQLFAAEADGTGHARLDAPAPADMQCGLPVVSADGRELVYLRTRVGEYQLWRQSADGSARNVLAFTRAPIVDFQIGPRGRFVLYTRGAEFSHYALAGVALTGGPSVVLAEDVLEFRIASTGGRVVYLTNPAAGPGELHSLRLTDRTNVLLARATSGEYVASFRLTPDGRTVVFETFSFSTFESRLWRVPTDGSAPAAQLLKPDGTEATGSLASAAILPDSSAIAFESLGRLYLAPFSGAVTRELGADVTLTRGVASFALAPDGSRVAIVLRGPDLPDVFIAPLAGGPSVSVLATEPQQNQIEFTSGSDRIVFMTGVVPFAGHVWSAPVAGGSAVQISDSLFTPGFVLSPDGGRAGFVTFDGTGRVVAVDGSSAPQAINETLGGVRDLVLGRERVFYSLDGTLEFEDSGLYSRLYTTLP